MRNRNNYNVTHHYEIITPQILAHGISDNDRDVWGQGSHGKLNCTALLWGF